MGTHNALLDCCSLEFSYFGYHLRKLVGLPCIRMGWFLVLGPGRKCIIITLVIRCSVIACFVSRRKKTSWTELGSVTRYRNFFAEFIRDFFSAFRCVSFCTHICQ